MAINGSAGNGFPAAIMAVIEQKNYLQTLIRKSIRPTLVYRPRVIGPLDWFQARIGETKTFTREGLIAPNTVALNPANNTGLDNGMTADVRSYEQWTATLNEYPGYIPTNILGQEAFIADVFLNNQMAMAQKAGNSLELLCVQRVFNAYDSGDSFCTAAITAGSVIMKIDNGNGFSTQFPTTNSPLYQTPATVTTSNKLPIAVVDKTTLLIKALTNVTNWQPDTTNVSYMQGPFGQFGNSGYLTFDVSPGACALGDRVVSLDPNGALSNTPPTIGQSLNPVWKDGSFVVRPLDTNGNMLPTGYAMAATSTMTPSIQIPYAVSILKRRGIPKLPNGLYGCAIDSTLLSSFYSDTGFQRATATNWDRGRYFQDGTIAAGWGIEFTEATQLPVYLSPVGGFSLRHAQVFGDGVISEHPFAGARDAADIVAQVGDVADERWVERIKFRNMAALDDLGQVIKSVYDYVGDFQCGTDKASNPFIVGTSDFMRYKRAVTIQAASPY